MPLGIVNDGIAAYSEHMCQQLRRFTSELVRALENKGSASGATSIAAAAVSALSHSLSGSADQVGSDQNSDRLVLTLCGVSSGCTTNVKCRSSNKSNTICLCLLSYVTPPTSCSSVSRK
jgi:hypothetical protein